MKLGASLLGALAVGVLLTVWLYRPWSNDKAQRAPRLTAFSKPDGAAFTPAAQEFAHTFIRTAVARRDPSAWRLIDPSFPCIQGSVRKAWQSGQLRFVQRGPFKHVRLRLEAVRSEGLMLDVAFDRRARYLMGLKRHGRDRWLVDWWDIRWGPRSAWCE